MNHVMANIQNGCRRGRTTIDHLVRLETFIRSSFAQNRHEVSVFFFYLKKAYDTARKYGIQRDMQQIGLKGRLPSYVGEFLSHKKFRVRVDGVYSNGYLQEKGVPEGCVLSVTLFTMRINGMHKAINNTSNSLSSLYVDGYQLAYSHSDLTVIEEQLQSSINRITEWTNNNGCEFSVEKTRAVHFTMKQGLHIKPTIKI